MSTKSPGARPMMNEAVPNSHTSRGPQRSLVGGAGPSGCRVFGRGRSELAGTPAMAAEFDVIGLGQWLRYLTGVLELAGAITLLVPGAALYGAARLAAVMCGALLAHAAIVGIATALPPLVLLLLAGTAAYFRLPRVNLEPWIPSRRSNCLQSGHFGSGTRRRSSSKKFSSITTS